METNMKKIKLTETELTNIIKKIINESQLLTEDIKCDIYPGGGDSCESGTCLPDPDNNFENCCMKIVNGNNQGCIDGYIQNDDFEGGYLDDSDEVARPMTSDCPDGCYDDGKKCWCDEWYTEKPRPVRENVIKINKPTLNKLIKKILNEKHLMLEYYVCSIGDNHTCGHCGNGSGKGNMSCDDNPSGGGLGVCYWPEGIGEAKCCYSDCGAIGPGGGVDDWVEMWSDDWDKSVYSDPDCDCPNGVGRQKRCGGNGCFETGPPGPLGRTAGPMRGRGPFTDRVR